MKRLVIAVDCDDVLLPSQEQIIRLYNTRYSTNVPVEAAYTAANGAWQADAATIAERIYDIQLSEEYGEVAPFADAIEVCHRLAEQHELHLVTARPGRLMTLTIAMLERYFEGVFREIEHVGLGGNKGDICRNLNADVLVDDSATHLETAAQCGISHLLWFGDYPWQSGGVKNGIAITCCHDWHEVEQVVDRLASVPQEAL